MLFPNSPCQTVTVSNATVALIPNEANPPSAWAVAVWHNGVLTQSAFVISKTIARGWYDQILAHIRNAESRETLSHISIVDDKTGETVTA